MATIANQIKRISDSKNLLNERGRLLGLQVPAGNYWDDTTKTYKAYAESTLAESDQIDKIAAAFNTINLYRDQNGKNEIKVPISVRTDGENTVVETTTLTPGYYYNTTIIPYIKVENVDDIVINVEMVNSRKLSVQSAVITPSAGFNYIGQFGYTIEDGAINSANAGFGNNYVTATVSKSGWLDANDTQNISVTESTMTQKIGNNAATSITSGISINPNPTQDTELTISKGIYGSNRTITIKSVGSQTGGTAKAEDILYGKEAWVAGVKVTGSMPNKGGTSDSAVSTNANGIKQIGDVLAIVPQLGYYNTYSNIITNIKYNPTRVFNTTNNSATDVETLTSQTYYETIPAGYYSQDIKKKITVGAGSGSVSIDYTTHKATFNVIKAGWFSSAITATISAGPARYKQTQTDLEDSDHMYKILPTMDQDGTKTSYLTEVTIDNSLIYDLLSVI